jgi:hypothetical protein
LLCIGNRLLVLPESALERPEDKQATIVAGNNDFLKSIVEGKLLMKFQVECKWAIDIWRSKMEQMREDQIYRAARTIQSLARMWMNRDEMEHQVSSIIVL